MVGHITGLLVFGCFFGWLIYDYHVNDGWCDFLSLVFVSPSFLFYLAAFWITTIAVGGCIFFLFQVLNDLINLLITDPSASEEIINTVLQSTE